LGIGYWKLSYWLLGCWVIGNWLLVVVMVLVIFIVIGVAMFSGLNTWFIVLGSQISHPIPTNHPSKIKS